MKAYLLASHDLIHLLGHSKRVTPRKHIPVVLAYRVLDAKVGLWYIFGLHAFKECDVEFGVERNDARSWVSGLQKADKGETYIISVLNNTLLNCSWVFASW